MPNPIKHLPEKNKTLMPPQRIIFVKRIKTVDEKKEFYDKKIEIAQRCAMILYSKGAKRVWLFGSLAEGEHFDRLTDIDIAVEGLRQPVLEHIRRNIVAQERTKIDIICLETANPGFRNEILKKRMLLSKGKVPLTPEIF